MCDVCDQMQSEGYICYMFYTAVIHFTSNYLSLSLSLSVSALIYFVYSGMLMSMLHTEQIHTHTHARSAQGVGHMTIYASARFLSTNSAFKCTGTQTSKQTPTHSATQRNEHVK